MKRNPPQGQVARKVHRCFLETAGYHPGLFETSSDHIVRGFAVNLMNRFKR
jgi:hypothetical protein